MLPASELSPYCGPAPATGSLPATTNTAPWLGYGSEFQHSRQPPQLGSTPYNSPRPNWINTPPILLTSVVRGPARLPMIHAHFPRTPHQHRTNTHHAQCLHCTQPQGQCLARPAQLQLLQRLQIAASPTARPSSTCTVHHTPHCALHLTLHRMQPRPAALACRVCGSCKLAARAPSSLQLPPPHPANISTSLPPLLLSLPPAPPLRLPAVPVALGAAGPSTILLGAATPLLTLTPVLTGAACC